MGAAAARPPGFAFPMEIVPCLGSVTSHADSRNCQCTVTPVYKLSLQNMTMTNTIIDEYDTVDALIGTPMVAENLFQL